MTPHHSGLDLSSTTFSSNSKSELKSAVNTSQLLWCLQRSTDWKGRFAQNRFRHIQSKKAQQSLTSRRFSDCKSSDWIMWGFNKKIQLTFSVTLCWFTLWRGFFQFSDMYRYMGLIWVLGTNFPLILEVKIIILFTVGMYWVSVYKLSLGVLIQLYDYCRGCSFWCCWIVMCYTNRCFNYLAAPFISLKEG